MERGYGEAPSRAVREGGGRGREASRKWGGICCRESERKKCLLVVPRRTNPNKHLLDGLVFLDGLDASNLN